MKYETPNWLWWAWIWQAFVALIGGSWLYDHHREILIGLLYGGFAGISIVSVGSLGVYYFHRWLNRVAIEDYQRQREEESDFS